MKEVGIPDHLTCLLRNLYAVQEATVRAGHGTTDWFQVRKQQLELDMEQQTGSDGKRSMSRLYIVTLVI